MNIGSLHACVRSPRDLQDLPDTYLCCICGIIYKYCKCGIWKLKNEA